MTEVLERRAFNEGLQHLNESVVTLAELAKLALTKSLHGLEHNSVEEAKEVLGLDPEVYALKQEIMKTSVDLIALYAPVARDLRTITAGLEISTDLDRIGRYAKDVAEVTEAAAGQNGQFSEKFPELRRMATLTIGLVDTAIEAFVHRDAEPVRSIRREDDAIDQLHQDIFHQIVRLMASRTLPPAIGAQYILVNRYLERVADHAVNIGEQVIYMVTGERPHPVPRSQGLEGRRAFSDG